MTKNLLQAEPAASSSMEADFIMRSLLGSSGSSGGQTCSCVDDLVLGPHYEHVVFLAVNWSLFAVCLSCLAFYGWHAWKATCGWEEVYVCIVELIKVIIEIFAEHYTPATVTQLYGTRTAWLRYGEWLLCCPVILIHLSNLTGLKNQYSTRTMALLVSDLGTLVMGVTAALASGPTKVVFFILGCLYAVNTYFNAAKVYIEAYHSVPKGTCRRLVKTMAWLFFGAWTAFPILFIMGPEGVGYLSVYGSLICHAVADLLSKNLWGLCGHELRIKVHEHILIHGDVRKETTINVAGENIHIEELVAEEDESRGAVRRSSQVYLSRHSFKVMRDNLKAKGKEVRMSLDGDDHSNTHDHETGHVTFNNNAYAGHNGPKRRSNRASINTSSGGAYCGDNQECPSSYSMYAGRSSTTDNTAFNHRGAADHGHLFGTGGVTGDESVTAVVTMGRQEGPKGGGGVKLQPGCVVLGVTDAALATFFREQFAALSASISVIPAMGVDAILSQVDSAAAFGGLDCVLLHPDYLQDQGAHSLLAALRERNQHVCAFGWTENGPERALIEGAGLDGWVKGPSYATGFDSAHLQQLMERMQQQRKPDTAGIAMRPHTATPTRSPSYGPSPIPSANHVLNNCINSAVHNAPPPNAASPINTSPSLFPSSPRQATSPHAASMTSSPRHPAMPADASTNAHQAQALNRMYGLGLNAHGLGPNTQALNPLYSTGERSPPPGSVGANAAGSAEADARLLETMIAQIERLRRHMATEQQQQQH